MIGFGSFLFGSLQQKAPPCLTTAISLLFTSSRVSPTGLVRKYLLLLSIIIISIIRWEWFFIAKSLFHSRSSWTVLSSLQLTFDLPTDVTWHLQRCVASSPKGFSACRSPMPLRHIIQTPRLKRDIKVIKWCHGCHGFLLFSCMCWFKPKAQVAQLWTFAWGTHQPSWGTVDLDQQCLHQQWQSNHTVLESPHDLSLLSKAVRSSVFLNQLYCEFIPILKHLDIWDLLMFGKHF